MPLVEDADSLMVALQEVMHAIASNRIDRARAGLLLYGIQTSAMILPRLADRPAGRVMIDTAAEGEDLTLPDPPPVAPKETSPALLGPGSINV
jgi:hypothetical protein